MGIAIADDHVELARVAAAFLVRHDARKAARAALDGGAALPPFWDDMVRLGWLGLHVAADVGGSGYGVAELAVVAEMLGRECVPGPFLPTAIVAGAIDRAGIPEQRKRLVPRLIAGDTTAGLGLHGSLTIHQDVLHGTAAPVLWAHGANVVGLAVGDDLAVIDRGAPGVSVETRANLDPTRPCATVRCDGVAVPPESLVRGGARHARRLLRICASAEATGGTAACREMATDYAKERVAFGRPIGQFQAIKHHCANMLVDEEMAAAAAWAAAQAEATDGDDVADHAAVAVCLAAFLRCAQRNVQVHGGIGFTWEHDAHLFLRRAAALQALAGPVVGARSLIARADVERLSRGPRLGLPPETEHFRTEARRFAADYWARPEGERHRFLAEAGYVFPHWPAPYGRSAGPVEQLVIDEELAEIPRDAALGPTAWTLPIVLPTVLNHGTEDQRQRWIRPTMDGELRWCQLFSEPGAGSDLAALSTRAVRTDDGWLVTGQKVWTSHAQHAQLGLALVRTNPAAPKHQGITCMVIDMTAPGITIRPLRQITGTAEFNEVFLDDVFVPDENVIGNVDDGWRVARTTLGNERISLGTGVGVPTELWQTLQRNALGQADADPCALAELGDLMATTLTLRALNVRAAARAVAGRDPGPEGNVTKLIGAEHVQQLANLALRLRSHEAVFADGDEAMVSTVFLQSRMTTIAGGTSEIVRNVIAERILGLPRDPEPA